MHHATCICTMCGQQYSRDEFYRLKLHGRVLPPQDPAGLTCLEGDGPDADTRECVCGNSLVVTFACTHRHAPSHEMPAATRFAMARARAARIKLDIWGQR